MTNTVACHLQTRVHEIRAAVKKTGHNTADGFARLGRAHAHQPPVGVRTDVIYLAALASAFGLYDTFEPIVTARAQQADGQAPAHR